MEATTTATQTADVQTPVIRKAGRPRKYADLAPGETGTYEQRKAIKSREERRETRMKDVEAFNRHKMELYHARAKKRLNDAQKVADLMAMLKSMIG